MVDEEIYHLTRHAHFQAEYIENIPIYRRRHFLYIHQKEVEKLQEEIDNVSNKSNINTKRPR